MALLDEDPFAPVRSLSFKKYRNEIAGLNDSEAGAMAQDRVDEGWTFADTDGPQSSSAALKEAGFQSKYNEAYEVDPVNYPGLLRVTLQNPAEGKNHKYDTLEAFYLVNPETGEGALVQDPVETRQVSSRESFKDIMEGKILPAAILMVAGGYAAGAMAGTGATATTASTAAAGTKTLGLTSAQWAAAKAAALKGAGWGAAANGGMTLARGGSVGDAFKAAAKGALVGGVTGGVGSAAGSALNLGATGQGALTSGTRALLGGGDAGDILKSAALGGVTSGANDYMKTELGMDPSTRAAITSGGRALLTGGDAKGALTSAGLSYFTTDDTKSGSKPVSTFSFDNDGYGDDIDWNADMSGGALTGDYTMGLDYDPTDTFSFDSNGVEFDFRGLDFSGGDGGGNTSVMSTIKGALKDLGLNDKDVLKLLAGGFTTAYKAREARKIRDANAEESDDRRAENRLWQLDDRAEGRTWQLDDRTALWARQDAEDDEDRTEFLADRNEDRKWVLDDRTAQEELAAKLLAEKFERRRGATGLLQPKLVKVGG